MRIEMDEGICLKESDMNSLIDSFIKPHEIIQIYFGSDASRISKFRLPGTLNFRKSASILRKANPD